MSKIYGMVALTQEHINLISILMSTNERSLKRQLEIASGDAEPALCKTRIKWYAEVIPRYAMIKPGLVSLSRKDLDDLLEVISTFKQPITQNMLNELNPAMRSKYFNSLNTLNELTHLLEKPYLT